MKELDEAIKWMIEPEKNVYLVSKTSLRDDSKKPCEEAYKVMMKKIDRRTTDDPAKIPASHGDGAWWYKKGTNHRVENGFICRDLGWREAWVVKVYDIYNFICEHGECVLSIKHEGFMEIEIYDDYRE